MSKAAQRRRSAQQARAKKPAITGQVDLNQWFYDLGDGDVMARFRTDIIKGLIQSSIRDQANLQRLMDHSSRQKTSSQTGFAVSMGDVYQSFKELHIGPFSGCSPVIMLETFKEFLADDRALLLPCICMGMDATKSISQGWGWQGKQGTISIKWFKPAGECLTMIGVVANDGLVLRHLEQEAVA